MPAGIILPIIKIEVKQSKLNNCPILDFYSKDFFSLEFDLVKFVASYFTQTVFLPFLP